MTHLEPIGELVAGWVDAPRSALGGALDYARRGWPVFPVTIEKRPLTAHGRTDATRDEKQLREWWRRWPRALAAIATGEEAGVVALDIDLREDCSGFDGLELLDVTAHPASPTAHTPRGGCHILFRHPGRFVKTIADKLGPALDIRGDGGSLTLPPGPGRRWDDHLGPDTPLAAMPEWMVIAEPPTPLPRQRPAAPRALTRYGEVALDSAVTRIVTAPQGAQEATLNNEAFGMGQLAGEGVLPPGLALDSLYWAARQMPSYDARRPWRPEYVERKVKGAFTDGLREPRGAPRA